MKNMTQRASAARRQIDRAVTETLETRVLMAAPKVLAPPPPDAESNTPENHFAIETGPQRLEYNFSESVDVAPGALLVTGLTGSLIGTSRATTMSGSGASRSFAIADPGSYGVPHSLPRGNYEAALNADLITNAHGELLDGNRDGAGGDDYVTSISSCPATSTTTASSTATITR